MTSDSKTPEQTDLVNLTIDGVSVSVPKGTLIIRAAEQIGVEIPRFCDHPLLAPVGACRQCLVEVAMPGPDGSLRQMQGPPGRMKPQASCTMTVSEGMEVKTQLTSPGAKKAQEGVMEMLLINHPLDCPVCDKGGECPLQNQALSHGTGHSRFAEQDLIKRTFPKPLNVSAMVLLDRERCVLCARCTRFSDEIAGDPFIALIERGAQQQVGIFNAGEEQSPGHLTRDGEPFDSYWSGNTIQICPVGALTSMEYRFRSRPFDLVSTPSIAEHDACGAAIRIDHRRGKVMRRLAGDDPSVNEEWISDKDRFAFHYLSQDRLTYPQVRDTETGELRPASWPEAFEVAARGLSAAGASGVLTGGRLTAEDAYAYAKFARTVLGTNDIDFRARPLSAEETDFLGQHVVLSQGPSYADLENASVVLLAGLEPEEEAGLIFLRLRKGSRKATRVVSLAPFSTRGLSKLKGTLIPTVPGAEAEELAKLKDATEIGLDANSIILVGERLATSPGALAAAAELAATHGAKLAWVPRRAGDRGAIEAGCLPTLLPGGRPVTDPAARVDVAAAWGVESLPDTVGRDTDGIVAALASGELSGLVIAGVDPADTADPAATRAAIANAGFVVALDVRSTEVTRAADVVFPAAAAVDKAGMFVTWNGLVRSFEAVFSSPNALPDLRALAGISEELGKPLGFRTPAQAREEMESIGPWDGARAGASGAAAAPVAGGEGDFVLASWKLMLDNGSMQDGDQYLRATAKTPVAVLNQSAADGLGAPSAVTVTGERGSVTLPVAVAHDAVDGVVWVPANSFGNGILADLGRPGTRVTVTAADAAAERGVEQ